MISHIWTLYYNICLLSVIYPFDIAGCSYSLQSHVSCLCSGYSDWPYFLPGYEQCRGTQNYTESEGIWGTCHASHVSIHLIPNIERFSHVRVPQYMFELVWKWYLYSKTCVKGHSKIDKTKVLMTNGSLMKV